jgi:hypothetical protein
MRRRYLDGPSMNCGYDQHPNTAKWNLQRERGGRPRSAAVAGPCCCCQGASSMEAVGEAPAWTRRRWRRNGIEAGMEEESARGGGGVGRSWMGRPLASGTQTSRRRLRERRNCRLRRRSRSVMTTGCGGGAESTRGARRWRRSGQRASQSWSWSRGVGPTGVGSPEVALRVEEEAWVNLAACRRLSQILRVRVQARATGSFYMWSTVATD